MRGSVFPYKLKSGGKRWRGQVELPGEGRERLTQAGFEKKRQAEDWVNQQIARLRASQAVKNSDATLAEFIEWWLKNKIEPDRSPTTHAAYTSAAAHVTKRLGTTKLHNLTAVALEECYADARRESDLSPKTVHNIHGVIHSALRAAVKRKLIQFNPANGCELPKVPKSRKGSLEPEQVVQYMRAADDSWIGPVVRLAAASGARLGEVLAMRWSDLDWMTGQLRVDKAIVRTTATGIIEKSTKEGDVDRPVFLDASTLEVLKMHRQRQAQEIEMFGKGYKQLGLICAKPDGRYLAPQYVSRVVSALGRKLGLPHVGMHALRHSHASLLVSVGVSIPDVAARLGHANPSTTAKIYAHALPSNRRKIADAWEGLMKK